MDEAYYIFEEKLEEGYLGEEEVKRLFKNFYLPIADRFLKHRGYKFGISPKNTQNQLSGKDGSGGSFFNYDVKLNQYYPDDRKLILLEVFSPGLNTPINKMGWFFQSEADVIFWLWKAKPKKTYLLDTGYYLFLKNIRTWFLRHPRNYKKYPIKKVPIPSKRKETGIKWDTYNQLIPLQDFPEKCILKIKKSSFETAIEESYFYRFFKNNKEV